MKFEEKLISIMNESFNSQAQNVIAKDFADYKNGLKNKIVKANEELKEIKFQYKTN